MSEQGQKDHDEAEQQYTLAALLASLDTESAALAISLIQRLYEGPPLTEEMAREDLIKNCVRLRERELSRRIQELRFLQQDAQDAQDADAIRDLDARIAELVTDSLRVRRYFRSAT